MRQYFVEICDPSLVRVTNLEENSEFVVGKAIKFCIDSSRSGEIQLDSITILGPNKSNNKTSSRAESDQQQNQTIFSRIKSISSSSSSSSSSTAIAQNNNSIVDHSVVRLSEHKQEVQFVPQVAGKYSIDIRCLGQSIGVSPFELEVVTSNGPQASPSSSQAPFNHQASVVEQQTNTTTNKAHKSGNTSKLQQSSSSASTSSQSSSREDELLQNIVVHGISLKCSPVNSTGAFIIETNRLAQARDFDVLITDPNNSLVDVQCYLQQDGNLLAEWTPKRVGK